MHRDSNYIGSRGLKALHLYKPSTLKRILQLQTAMNDDENFPRNYDLCISVLSASFDILGLMGGLDNKMQAEHPEIFGKDDNPVWPRMIVVYAQWVPFGPDDKPDESWFDDLKAGCWFSGGVREKPMSQLVGRSFLFPGASFVTQFEADQQLSDGRMAVPKHAGVRPPIRKAHVSNNLHRAQHQRLG